MHKRHTIACLGCGHSQLTELLHQEDRAGRTIHTPRQFFNPEAGRWHYHWTLRGHDRQITYEQVELIMEHKNTVSWKHIPSACAFSR